jgi:hypothetical protein
MLSFAKTEPTLKSTTYGEACNMFTRTEFSWSTTPVAFLEFLAGISRNEQRNLQDSFRSGSVQVAWRLHRALPHKRHQRRHLIPLTPVLAVENVVAKENDDSVATKPTKADSAGF